MIYLQKQVALAGWGLIKWGNIDRMKEPFYKNNIICDLEFSSLLQYTDGP